MKKKFKHTSVQRLHWRNSQRRWRVAHPERAREIRRRYWRKKRGHYVASEKKEREESCL
jgi:hypothetical protein